MSCDFVALAVEGVRTLQPYQPGKPIEELQRELGLDDVVKLASNESPLGPGPNARAAIAACLEDLARYPDGNGFALKVKLAARLGVEPAALTLGNGSNDVLELLVRTFATSAHEVVFSRHAFAVYPLATQAVGARAVVVPARQWGHDLEAMADALTERTRLVFVANPNNPTGTWVDADSLGGFLERVPEHVIVVVDEAYFEYAQGPGYPDCVRWLARHRNLVVTRTFSKVHGLAALRVGYAVSDPVIADLLNRVRQPFNVNSLALAGAVAALDDEAHVARSLEINRRGMAQLTGAFDEMGLEHIPSAGNFVAVHVGGSAEEVYRELLRRAVIVRPVGGGYAMPEHLRVTVGLESENARFLGALAQTLRERDGG